MEHRLTCAVEDALKQRELLVERMREASAGGDEWQLMLLQHLIDTLDDALAIVADAETRQ
jgi:hypothetical protein